MFLLGILGLKVTIIPVAALFYFIFYFIKLLKLITCANFGCVLQEYTMTEHIRMSGMYWGITAIDLLGCLGRMERQQIVEFIQQCQDTTSGGISPSTHHDPHMLSTLSAVQVKGVQWLC